MLEQIPEAERAALMPHITKWDAGHTRRLMEVESQYAGLAPYADYDPEDLEMAARVWDMFNQDPTGTIEMLQRASGGQGAPQQQPQFPQQQPQQVAPGQPGFVPQLQQQPQYAQLPPHVEQMLQQQQRAIESMALNQQQQLQAQRDQEADAQFEQYIESLHRELGDFDDSIVINNLAAGMEPAQAVQAFRAQWQPVAQASNGGQPVPPPVPVLNGGSAVSGQVPIAQASDKQRRATVAQMLEHARQS